MSVHRLHVAVTGLMDLIAAKHKTKIEVREIFSSGKSGAFVGLVDCTGANDGVYVLKADWLPRGWEDEETKHTRALQEGAFSGKLPPIVLSAKTATHYGLLLKIAGDSRITARPLVGSLKLFASAYSAFSRIAWVPALNSFGDQIQASQILRDCLSYRLSKSQGGRIEDNISEFLKPGLLNRSKFGHCEEVLPNPYCFATSPKASTPLLKPLCGPIHGDCHSQNLFVRAALDGSIQDVFLIDLASYHSRSIFFFDHAYLELATMLRQLDQLGEHRWLAFAKAVAGTTGANALEQHERGWFEDISAGRTELLTQIGTHVARQDDLKLQFLLMHVAAGLAFLNKQPRGDAGSGGLSAAQYQQAFVWSAVFLAEFLRLVGPSGSQWDTDTSARAIPVLGMPSANAAQGPSAEVWRQVGYYNASGFNVLVLGPSEKKRPEDILGMPWNLVVDFNTKADERVIRSMHRLFRQSWPGHIIEDFRLFTRGALWYFANGRCDLSEAPPMPSSGDWRRKYGRALEDLLLGVANTVAPPRVRALVLSDDLDTDQLRKVCESLDNAFHSDLAPVIIASKHGDVELPTTASTVGASVASVESSLRGEREPQPIAIEAPVVPRRGRDRTTLEAIPEDLLQRISRDFTLVFRAQAQRFPADRVFGIDFRRGMPIEWSELAQNLDVPRDATGSYLKTVDDRLNSSSNHTVNLLHQPSAGGTTLSRRIAWEFMEKFPVAVLNQLSADSASHLRDLFRFCSLPVLVVMEATVITESEREGLLQQLREDNTRAVFLWVSRTYRQPTRKDALPGLLSDDEAKNFCTAYIQQVADPSRRAELERLANSDALKEQRNPFFFGLFAFGERFLGIDRLIQDTILALREPDKRMLVADLALASLYCNDGLPLSDFDELCKRYSGGEWPVPKDSLFLIADDDHVRVSHALLAEKSLSALARNASNWKSDLTRFSIDLLDRLKTLSHLQSDRLQNVVKTLFITRDIESALQADADIISGGIPSHRRFAPLINDVGNVAQARVILNRVSEQWPDEPHYAAHLARHLLYEEPREIEKGIETAISAMAGAKKDAALVHTVGMAYRVRMQQRLSEGVKAGAQYSSLEASTRADYDQAVTHFQASLALKPANEHALVATIQTVSALLTLSMEITGIQPLARFLDNPAREWFLEALGLAEDCIESLRNRPGMSERSERTITEWKLVYGDYDSVIRGLRALAARHEDQGLRRALCAAIMAKAQHNWLRLNQADLRTISLMMERNINEQGVRDADVRRWFHAYRHMSTFEPQVAVERLIDWHRLNPKAVDPPYYLYILYFIRWLEASAPKEGFAREVSKWLALCQQNRPLGLGTWSYDWLERIGKSYRAIHSRDLPFDPPSIIRTEPSTERARHLSRFVRIEGTMVDYRGPQYASLDLGQKLRARLTPLHKLSKDDNGSKVTAFLSFSYDGIVGWDPELLEDRRATPA